MDIQAYPDVANNAVGYVYRGYRDYSQAYRVYRDWRLRQGVTSSLQSRIGPLTGPPPPPAAKMVQPMGGTDGAIGPVNQIGYSRSYRGHRKRFKRNVYNLYKRIELSTFWRQSRYEGLTNLGNANGYGYYWLSNFGIAANKVDLPVYAFNLSDLDQSYNLTTSKVMMTKPFYRLTGTTGATGGVRNYNWSWQAGNYGPVYINEDRNHITQSSNTWRHDWSDIKLLCYGAKNRPIKYHLYVVTFPNGAGPLRVGVDDVADVALDPALSSDDADRTDEWWEHFLAPKMYNPLRTSKYVDKKQMNVLHHESFVIGNDVSINNDTAPVQVVKKLFYRNGNYYRTKSTLNHEIGVGSLTTLYQFDNVAMNDACNGVAAREATQWLLIVGEVFDNIAYGGSNTNTTQPSFDLCVRSKWQVVN